MVQNEQVASMVEIVDTIHGEVPFTGLPTRILRFADCNLSCSYCDTKYEEEFQITLKDLLTRLKKDPIYNLLITGGEPLLQAPFIQALLLKLPKTYDIVIETNGTLPLFEHPFLNLTWVMDIKNWVGVNETTEANLEMLHEWDIVKFVVYDKASLVSQYLNWNSIYKRFPYLRYYFSPTPELLKNRHFKDLVKSLIKISINVPNWNTGINVQIHKLLGVE